MSHYKSKLLPRDVCSDAFGSGATDATCNPSDTLCCVRFGDAYPACQQYLGKGWCCVGGDDTDNCYVDQESVCDQANSVACSNLAAGTTKACCPRLTTCADNYNFTDSSVRCNIQRGDLIQLAAASSSSTVSSTTTSTSSSTSTSISTTSSSVSSSTSVSSSSTPTSAAATGNLSSSNTISGGVLAGVVIGPIIALILAVILVYLVIRRCVRRRRGNSNMISNPMVVPVQHETKYNYGGHNQFGGQAIHPSSELSSVKPTSELAATPSHYQSSTFELPSPPSQR